MAGVHSPEVALLGSESNTPAIYTFGVFQVDVERNELLRKGITVRLQDQPFRLLLALLEAEGVVVSKEKLRERLWPGNTFVEVDVSLSVAVGKLREALGDDAANPRYIETVPRRGYRFIAPVQKLEPAVQPAPSIPAARKKSLVPFAAALQRYRTRNAIILISTGAAILAAGLIYYSSSRRTLPPGGVHSVVVSDFTNNTGDPIFDGSLRRALIVELAQSPSFLVHSDITIDEALQDLGRPPAAGTRYA